MLCTGYVPQRGSGLDASLSVLIIANFKYTNLIFHVGVYFQEKAIFVHSSSIKDIARCSQCDDNLYTIFYDPIDLRILTALLFLTTLNPNFHSNTIQLHLKQTVYSTEQATWSFTEYEGCNG